MVAPPCDSSHGWVFFVRQTASRAKAQEKRGLESVKFDHLVCWRVLAMPETMPDIDPNESTRFYNTTIHSAP